MKRVTRVILILLLCTILTLAGCKKAADPAEESSQLLFSDPVLQTETELASDTVHGSDIDLDSNPADTTSAPTESTEPPIEVTELPEPDTTVPQSSEAETEPAPTETEKAADPKPTEPKPTTPAPTEPKPSEPAPTQPTPTEPAPTQPAPTEPPHVHSWGAWQQTTAPTCGKTGEEKRTCTGCGATESRTLAATGQHSWKETAPTCTQDGAKTCTVCGAKETLPALGHDWVHHAEEGHWQALVTCYCGAQFGSVDEWEAHASASSDLAYLDAHSGYELHEVWKVDTPAQDVCSRCGAVK